MKNRQPPPPLNPPPRPPRPPSVEALMRDIGEAADIAVGSAHRAADELVDMIEDVV